MSTSFIAHFERKGHRGKGFSGRQKHLVASVEPVNIETGAERSEEPGERGPSSPVEPCSEGPTEASPVKP